MDAIGEDEIHNAIDIGEQDKTNLHMSAVTGHEIVADSFVPLYHAKTRHLCVAILQYVAAFVVEEYPAYQGPSDEVVGSISRAGWQELRRRQSTEYACQVKRNYSIRLAYTY